MNKQKAIYEVEEIGKIIDFIKTEKNITDISETNGISTIISDSLRLLHSDNDIYLAVGQIVTLNKINYQVLSVNLDLKQFTIAASGLYHMSTDIIPVKVLDVTKWNLAINYLYGSRIEINEILVNAQSDPQKNLQRFPLIWLFVNNTEDCNPDLLTDFKTNLKFSIVQLTNKAYKASDRLTHIFKPVLEPICNIFFETMKSPFCRNMLYFEYEKTPYKKYKRFFYGSSDKNENVLSSCTDAIEISIDLNFLKQF